MADAEMSIEEEHHPENPLNKKEGLFDAWRVGDFVSVFDIKLQTLEKEDDF